MLLIFYGWKWKNNDTFMWIQQKLADPTVGANCILLIFYG